MRHRELPRAEWDRLRGIGAELELALGVLPADARIVVVETDDGAIVGSWAGLRYMHCEGLSIAPGHQKRAAVGLHLLEGMRAIAQSWDTKAALTAALTPEVRRLIVRCGGMKLPGEHFAFPIGGQ